MRRPGILGSALIAVATIAASALLTAPLRGRGGFWTWIGIVVVITIAAIAALDDLGGRDG